MENKNTSNPLEHTANVKKEFTLLINHLRGDVSKNERTCCQGAFEVSAEVLTGLKKAFTDYEKKNEAAWNSKYKML